ncbi:hypothetical protein LTR85_007991 [Meristemomyces frigidus]|nr:hypothetical protein LTR85_007991 [Meristemomyces frigidus]
MAVESPGVYPESPHDQEDVVYPCKGCGEILEEGKAFELAGNRWHIDCFRCNTCGTLLDSDANLLLLGDGSLICNNCTYSCNACGNKIEDLAILTGDQAFCAACFRCRNCKRKIENLRYARTSQGIFCMSCHESLMARRRKKAKTGPRQAQGGASGAGPAEKALPSLPPGAASSSAFSPDIETPPSETYTDTPSARSPRNQYLTSRKDASSSNLRRDVSPVSDEASRDGPTLPASTYSEAGRPSNVSEDTEDGEERGYLPMAFDPTPVPGQPPTIARKQVPRPQDPSPPVQGENRLPKDYFSGRLSAKSANRDVVREERPVSTRSVSTEREPTRIVSQSKASPHILFQDKARHKRQASGSSTPASSSAVASPAMASAVDGRLERPKPQHLDTSSYTLGSSESFKLQEVPQNRKAGSRSSSKADTKSPILVSPIDGNAREQRAEKSRAHSPVSVGSPESGVNPFDDPRRKDVSAPSSVPPPKHADRPARGDSLAASALRAKPATPEPPTPTTAPSPSTVSTQLAPGHERKGSASSVPSSFADASSTLSRGNSGSHTRTLESPPFRGSFDAPPPRNSSRPSAPSKSVANGDFIAPRAPPPPPPVERHKHHESISTMQSMDARSDGQLSPVMRSAGLPKHSTDGGFSMEEEMARILRGEKRESHQNGDAVPSSVLRRVSNAVKHGRSFSDRGLSSAGKSSQSPHNGSLDISSPMTVGSPAISSPTSKEPIEQLRAVNRRANQQMAALEAENQALREHINSSAEIKAASTELRQKRDTIVVLDAQREMVVAELESMTAHLRRAKDSNHPLDLGALKTDILKDFADSLQKLKDQLSCQIEDLMHKRNELTEEIGTLIQMKDKGFQEYESLSGRNNQLIEMNNQLVHNIQETYKANRVPNGVSLGSTNGLGIYHPGAKQEPLGHSDVRNLNLVSTDSSMPNLLQETEAEPATILTAPQVVNIRKGQPKKFNWRKGGEKMAKNVTKGLKGAFVGDKPLDRREIGMPYTDIGVPYNATHQASAGSEQSSLASKQTLDKNNAAGFGFFGQKNGGLKAGGMGSMKNGSSTNLAASADPSVLFGSELEARCEFERRVVPSIVSRCIQEVEARGMDVEGVYRKSGGSGQVKTVQQGFEKDGDYDISDEDLDIHAVTSALKQYFRKLPTPLITYDVYETLLEAGQTPDRERQAYNLRMAVAELPEHHRNCLEYLIQHLARVMSHESENLMTPLNLAVVFAPTIMRPESIEREMSDMQAQRVALQALLDQHKIVFGEDE